MKKILLSISAVITFAINVSAQCIPDTSITHNDPGIYPDTIVNLPHAIIGEAYATTIQMKVLTDTTTVILGSTVPVTIDSIVLTDVSGIPSGFTYTCTPSNCSFPGGADVCVYIQGAPPTFPMIGTYPLIVNTMVYGHYNAISLPPQATPVPGYKIVIDDNVGISLLSTTTFDVTQNMPNPFSGISQIGFTSPSADVITMKVSDILGNVVSTKQIMSQKGLNKIQLSAKDYAPGIYMYTLSNGKTAITKRMIVSNE